MPQQPILAPVPPPRDEAILYFTLEGLFPQGHTLAYHRSLGILSLLCPDKQVPYPRLIAQQQFSERERDLLLPLLTSYPHFTPYEVLHVSFYQGFTRLSEQAVLQAKQRIDGLRAEQGLWDAEIKPLRNVMARVRVRLREVGLDSVCMLETGYILVKNTAQKW
jgi:hypothetical protein